MAEEPASPCRTFLQIVLVWLFERLTPKPMFTFTPSVGASHLVGVNIDDSQGVEKGSVLRRSTQPITTLPSPSEGHLKNALNLRIGISPYGYRGLAANGNLAEVAVHPNAVSRRRSEWKKQSLPKT
jgi:hypothetical protein